MTDKRAEFVSDARALKASNPGHAGVYALWVGNIDGPAEPPVDAELRSSNAA